MSVQPSIVIVTRPTRLAGLRQRWGTLGQAKFKLRASRAIESNLPSISPRARSSAIPSCPPDVQASAQADFDAYTDEDRVYRMAIERLQNDLLLGYPIKTIDRSYVPNFDFGMTGVVVVVGPDGLVANVAKYVGDVPIVAINPDPARIDGILLPFEVHEAVDAVRSALNQRAAIQSVSLAEANLNDGQKMLAFNDFYIGAASHISSRYVLTAGNRSEPQSSSGVLVCTGAGSTGWISSVFNMAAGVAKSLGREVPKPSALAWDERQLIWAVREPFQSRTSEIGLVTGRLPERSQLQIESLMPEHGVIFSDGIELDYLPFTSGSIVKISVSQQCAHLVIKR